MLFQQLNLKSQLGEAWKPSFLKNIANFLAALCISFTDSRYSNTVLLSVPIRYCSIQYVMANITHPGSLHRHVASTIYNLFCCSLFQLYLSVLHTEIVDCPTVYSSINPLTDTLRSSFSKISNFCFQVILCNFRSFWLFLPPFICCFQHYVHCTITVNYQSRLWCTSVHVCGNRDTGCF